MKKILCFLVVLLIFPNYSSAFKYTEDDKKMFYEAFIDGYVTEMGKRIEASNATSEQKENFMETIKSNIDEQELIESSWNCIQSYPIEQIVAASVICTYNWTAKQNKKNESIYKLLK